MFPIPIISNTQKAVLIGQYNLWMTVIDHVGYISVRYVFNLDFHVSGVCIHLSKLGIAWADKTLDVRVNLLTVLFAVYGRIYVYRE